MILLDSNGVAVRRRALRLTETAAIGLGWVAPDFNDGNASLIDQPDPSPWVAGAWRWDGQQWAEEKPDLIDAIRNPPFDLAAAIQSEITISTQKRLDDFARERFYDGILSLCTYATSQYPKFRAEGQYGVTARDGTWGKLYEILIAVQDGTRPMPSGYAEIESELPALVWP